MENLHGDVGVKYCSSCVVMLGHLSMYLTILFTIITKLEKSTRLPEVG